MKSRRQFLRVLACTPLLSVVPVPKALAGVPVGFSAAFKALGKIVLSSGLGWAIDKALSEAYSAYKNSPEGIHVKEVHKDNGLTEDHVRECPACEKIGGAIREKYLSIAGQKQYWTSEQSRPQPHLVCQTWGDGAVFEDYSRLPFSNNCHVLIEGSDGVFYALPGTIRSR